MMKKMIPNEMFYAHYPYRPDMEDSVIIKNIFFTYIYFPFYTIPYDFFSPIWLYIIHSISCIELFW